MPGAAAAQASTSTPAGVPAGKVQHTVTERTLLENGAPPPRGTWHVISEHWVSATASRSVETNAETGAVLDECTSIGAAWSCFYPATNLMEKGTGDDPLIAASWAQQGALKRQDTTERKIGTGTDLGRPVDIYQVSDDDVTDSTIDLDVATGYPLRVESSVRPGLSNGLTQTTVVTTFETLDASTVSLGMTAHPSAVVKRVKGAKSPVVKHPRSTRRSSTPRSTSTPRRSLTADGRDAGGSRHRHLRGHRGRAGRGRTPARGSSCAGSAVRRRGSSTRRAASWSGSSPGGSRSGCCATRSTTGTGCG